MNNVTEAHGATPGDSFEQQLGSAMRSGVSIPPHDPSFGDGVRSRVRTRQRRRRVTYIGVVLLFAGLLGGLSLGSMITSDPGSDLATQPNNGPSPDDSVGDGGDANGEREMTPAREGDAASDTAQKPPPVDERLDPPTAWEEAASLLLILGVPLAVGALTVLTGAGRPIRRRVASAVFATLSAQTLVLCVTGVALMYTYQPLPPEIAGASLDSIDQDMGPGIIRGVHAFGSVLFPLLLVVGVLVVIFTLPGESNASGLVLRLIVAMVSVGWIAEGLLRTGSIVGWDQLAVTDVAAGTDIRGVGRPLDLGTVRGDDSRIVEIISDGKVLGVDGYRSAFVEHLLLAGLLVAVLAAGFVWTRRSMSTTRLTAWVGAWIAAFGIRPLRQRH